MKKHELFLIFLISIILIISFFFITTLKQPQCYGLYLGQNLNIEIIKNAEKKYDKKPCAILTFIGWGDRPFDNNLKDLEAIQQYGSIPIITIEPWLSESKKGVPLDDIANGKEDVVLEEFSSIIKKLKGPIFIRFAHEMNGNWYPWSGAQNNKDAQAYVRAYRKVHEVIKKATAGIKIYWIWSLNSENIPKEKWNEPIFYYPGDAYVDAVGIDGYNWNHTKEWSNERNFEEIFKEQIKYVKVYFKNKPLYITEMASSGSSKEKPAWIENFFHKISNRYNFIPLFIWFDLNKETNWQIASDNQSLDSFRTGLRKLKNSDKNILLKDNGQ